MTARRPQVQFGAEARHVVHYMRMSGNGSDRRGHGHVNTIRSRLIRELERDVAALNQVECPSRSQWRAVVLSRERQGTGDDIRRHVRVRREIR